MSIKGLKLITFDVTNTLLKFKVPPWQYYTIIAKNYGFKGSGSEIQSRLKENMTVMLKEHPNFGKTTMSWEKWWSQVVKKTLDGLLPPTTDLDIVATKIIDDFRTQKCWSLVDNGENLVDHLKSLGLCVGIISNFDPRLHDILQDMSLYKKFDFIATSYEVGYSKPDKRIFQTAIEMSNKKISPTEALHIGDDVKKDYEGAKAAGWHAVLINTASEKPLPSEHVFSNLTVLFENITQGKLNL